MTDLSQIKFDSNGLVAAIVQDAGSKAVLMVAYMNQEALEKTIEGPDVWFFSRSRNELWHKGATSGNYLRTVSVTPDCDGDALLVMANPVGPACHTGNQTCFFEEPLVSNESTPTTASIIDELAELIAQRKREMPEGSYTSKLFSDGPPRIAQKVVEEAGEVAIAAVAPDGGNATEEVADMLYHTLVLLAAKGIDIADVWSELAKRRK